MADKFISIKDATARLGVTDATLYYYIKRLKLETKKFPLDKRTYLLESDVEHIEALRAEAQARREGEEEAA